MHFGGLFGWLQGSKLGAAEGMSPGTPTPPTLETPMKTQITASALALLLVVGCDNDPVKDAPRAQTSEAAPVVEKKVEAEEVQTLAINQDNSSVGFVGAKVTDKHEGSFKKFSGELKLAPSDITKSSVNVTIDMKTVETDTPKLTGHLKSPDFFDVEKFPEAKFVSTKIEKSGDQYQITGNLSLHGVNKAITFPAKIRSGKGDVSVQAEFGINRKDFEIVYPGMPDDLIKDEVLIRLELKPSPS